MENNSSNEKLIKIDSCTKCSKTLRDEWEFCPYCKTPVETHSCLYCGKILKKVWEFCPYCKSKINDNAEIKQSFDYSNDWLRSILND